MRIIYNAKCNPESDNTEDHIRYSLRALGCEVFSEGRGDIYLFHKRYAPPPEFYGLKVLWYFDKVEFGNREESFRELASKADMVFMTDGSYAPRIGAHVLHQGIAEEDYGPAMPFSNITEEIGFIGGVYGERGQFASDLMKRYGQRFGVFMGYHGRDLGSLCSSLKIVVAPEHPSTNHYWSNRLYLTLGRGGFLLHPNLKGIEEEYEDGVDLVLYKGMDDLMEKIDYYLEHPKEREMIRRAGMKKTIEKYNFTERCRYLLAQVNTGIKG